MTDETRKSTTAETSNYGGKPMNTIITSTARFEDLELTVIHKDGERWLTAEQAGKALGFAHPHNGVWKLFKRYQEEFEDGEDYTVAKLATVTGLRDTIIFSPTGCMLLGMFARTPRAKAFRKWAKHLLAEAALDPHKVREELLAARPLWRAILRLKLMRGPLGECLTNGDIARILRIDRSTLRRHLRRMEALGIVEPSPDYGKYRRLAANLPLFSNLDNLH